MVRGFLIGVVMGTFVGPIVIVALARWRWRIKEDFVSGWDSPERRYALTKERGSWER